MKKNVRITYITQRVLMVFVLVISVLGFILNEDESVRADYVFNIGQCCMFLLISFLPDFLKRYKLDIPDFIYIIFILFCMAHFFLGEILGFFVKVSWWDNLLHTFSGCMIALLSFSLINLLNKTNGKDFKLNIWFASIFAFALTLAIGALWEIYEFASDMLFESNMQRAYVSTMSGRGEPLVGMAALEDTMNDLILDAVGGLIVCVVCAICVKTNKLKLEDLSVIKKQSQEEKFGVGQGNKLESKIFVDKKVKKATTNSIKKENPKQNA